MHWYRIVGAGLFTVTAICLISLPCLGDLHGPTVAIDLETTTVPDLSTIDSVYSGGAEFIYAFLVVDDMPGGYISGYDLGFELVSPNSDVVNLGFVRLPGWRFQDIMSQTLPADVSLPGKDAPAAIGYWILALSSGTESAFGNGTQSEGELRLVSNPAGAVAGIRLFDGRGLPVEPVRATGGRIGGRTVDFPSPVTIIQTNPFGKPVCENRNASHVPGEVIVRFFGGVVDLPEGSVSSDVQVFATADARRVLSQFGILGTRRVFQSVTRDGITITTRSGRTERLEGFWDVYLLTFPSQVDVWAVVDSLRSLPGCIYVEPNYLGSYAARSPNDHYYEINAQWNIDRMKLPAAWERAVGNESIIIGIVDTGIDYRHEELGETWGPGQKVVGGWNYLDDDDDFMEESPASHGTMMAGIVAAITNNDEGVAGVAGGWYPGKLGCSLHASKVNTIYAAIPDAAMAAAILGAVSRGDTQVLNMSFRKPSVGLVAWQAMAAAHIADIVCVAAKGNQGSDALSYPADMRLDWVIGTGGSNDLTTIYESRFHVAQGFNNSSNYDNGLDVVAPGVLIWSTTRIDTAAYPGHYDRFNSGTSMSTAHVSGLAGLIRSMRPDLCVDDVEGIVCASCKDITTDEEGGSGPDMIGFDKWSGWGRINAGNALAYVDSSEDWEIHRFTHTGGNVVSTSGSFLMTFDIEGGPYFFLAKRHAVEADVTYPMSTDEFRHVWGRGIGASTGLSPYAWNFDQGYCQLNEGTESPTGCTLRTFIYQLWSYPYPEVYYGWHPCEAHEVEFAYSVLARACASVDPDTRDPASDGRIEVRLTPNPMIGEVTIRVVSAEECNLEVRIYDTMGRLVRKVHSGRFSEGRHDIVWDRRNDDGQPVEGGVYVVKAETSEETVVKKLVLVR